MIECFDFILYLCIYLNMVRCQLIIGGKKVGYSVMTEQQHHSCIITLRGNIVLSEDPGGWGLGLRAPI
jgi:hypothetical protein